MTAAIPTSAPSNGTTSASVARSDAIAPPAGSVSIRRPRSATSVHASASDSTPATCAAAISPIEWPATTSGRTPHDSTSRNSATSIANSAGWVNTVRSIARSSAPHTTSRSVGSNSTMIASNASANAGNRAYSSRPMPSRWEPWPVNRNASLPSAVTPRATSATPSSTTARCSNAHRPVASE